MRKWRMMHFRLCGALLNPYRTEPREFFFKDHSARYPFKDIYEPIDDEL